MKRKSAKEILADSFKELAETMPVDKISVKDIVDNCEYSHATFYRYFRDKYELISWGLEQYYKNIIPIYIDLEKPWSQIILDGAKGLYEEKQFFTNLITHTYGQDSFIRHMTRIHCSIMKEIILERNEDVELSETEEIYIRTFCLGSTGIIVEWLVGKYKISIEEMAKIIEDFTPEVLQVYLHN